MRTRINPILEKIGSTLEQRLQPITTEPLPKRWVELIHFQNERERMGEESMKADVDKAKRTAR